MNLGWLGLADANTRWVLVGSVLLAFSAGVLGSFAFLQRRSLVGDVLAHAALPGVCVAFLLTGQKDIGVFLIGAAIAGVLGTGAMSVVTRHTRIKEDAAMGLVLTVFFAFGIMLLTMIQNTPRGNQSGLDKFLFGQAASLIGRDVQVMAVVAAALCLATLLLFKEFKLVSFDPGFGAGLGLPTGWLSALLYVLIVLAVVIGLQAVGVVLMAAMLITPPAAARYWVDRLEAMVPLSGLFGAVSGVAGTIVSQLGPRMPTGPLIVLAATAVFFISMLLAPRRGLIARLLRFLHVRRRVERAGVLRALYERAEAVGRPDAACSVAELAERQAVSGARLVRLLTALARAGLVQPVGGADAVAGNDATEASGGWQLTEAGLAEAYELVRERRLWEVYLMHEGELDAPWLERDSASVAALPVYVQHELARLLRWHNLEPRLVPAGGTPVTAGKEAR